MLILAVDTSARTGSLALLCDAELLGEVSSVEETPYSTRLFRDLEILQARTPFRLDEINVFAVVSGPGSFTGLRIGLTAVKAWAEVHGKPIAAISALEAVAAQSKACRENHGSNSRTIAPFLDARRGQLFGSAYRVHSENGGRLESISEEWIVSPEEFLENVRLNASSGVPVMVSPAPNLLSASRVEEIFPGVRIEVVSAALAPVIGRLGYERALRGDLVDPLTLDANYVRRSDAEAAWRDA